MNLLHQGHACLQVKMIKINFIGPIFIFILILSGNGCMKKNISEISVFLKPIKVNSTLDPSQLRFVNEYIFLDNLSLRLVTFADNGEYSNELANKFVFKNDRKDIFIEIKDAYFSDGKKITVDDVINSFKRTILKGSPHSTPKEFIRGADKLTSFEQDIEGLKKINSNTFFIGLKGQMKELFYYLQLTDYAILHPTQYNKKDDLKIEDWVKVTSGPYRLEIQDNNISFVSNEKTLNYSKDAPQKVTPIYYEQTQIISKIKNNELHIGDIQFSDYVKLRKELLDLKNIKIFGGITDGIVTLTLNLKSNKFKSSKVRQWIQRKVLESYTVKTHQEDYMKKAYQHFLPNAKGHLSEELVIQMLPDDVDSSQIPDELKNGITIRALPGMKNYLPNNFKVELEKALGIPVIIKYDIDRDKYVEEMGKRDFEAYIIASSMSYKVIGETLSLHYSSENPLWLDPTKKIKHYLEQYQKTDNNKSENDFIHKILTQMIIDAECIPLFYFANPSFYNDKYIDVKNIFIEESLQFWRLHVK